MLKLPLIFIHRLAENDALPGRQVKMTREGQRMSLEVAEIEGHHAIRRLLADEDLKRGLSAGDCGRPVQLALGPGGSLVVLSQGWRGDAAAEIVTVDLRGPLPVDGGPLPRLIVPFPEDAGELQASDEPLEILLATKQAQERISAILVVLPEDYRTALLWRYWEKRSAEEIGAEIGRTPKAVERLLARARQQFKEQWLSVEAGQ